MIPGNDTLKRLVRVALVVSIGLVSTAAGCQPPDPAPTTTTTSSTSTSLPGGPCDGYTPTNVGTSSSSTSAGSTIQVTGNGSPGSTVTITLVEVSSGDPLDPGVSAVVAPNGIFATNLTLPGAMDPGEWDVVATAGEDCSASTRIDILP